MEAAPAATTYESHGTYSAPSYSKATVAWIVVVIIIVLVLIWMFMSGEEDFSAGRDLGKFFLVTSHASGDLGDFPGLANVKAGGAFQAIKIRGQKDRYHLGFFPDGSISPPKPPVAQFVAMSRDATHFEAQDQHGIIQIFITNDSLGHRVTFMRRVQRGAMRSAFVALGPALLTAAPAPAPHPVSGHDAKPHRGY